MKLTIQKETNKYPHKYEDMNIGDIAINLAEIFVIRTTKGWAYFDGGVDPEGGIDCRILPKGTKILIEV